MKTSVFIIALLLIPAVMADSQVVDSTYETGSSIAVEGRTYILHLGEDNEVLADYGVGGLFINNNTCRSDEIAKICIDNIELNTDTREYDISVRAFSIAPDIDISRSIDDADIRISEEAIISVDISNEGNAANDFVYTDVFPEGIEITDNDGGIVRGNTFTWKGNVKRDETAEFSYTIKGNKPMERSLVAEATYWDGIKTKRVFTNAISLEVIGAVELETEVHDDDLFIGEETNITIDLLNKVNASVDIDVLTVTFNDGVLVTKVPSGFTKSGSTYTWNGAIPRYNASSDQASRRLIFDFRGVKEGSTNIFVDATYTHDKLTATLDKKKESLSIKDKGVIIRTNLNDDVLESNQRGRLKIWLQNLNPYVAIKNVVVKSNSDLIEIPDFERNEISPGVQLTIFDKNYYAALVEKTTPQNLRVNVSYETALGEKHFSTFSDAISVVPVKDLVISRSFSKNNIRAGDETIVSVQVENPREVTIHQVSVAETMPEGIEPIGPISSKISISSKDKVTAYSYRIIAPRLPSKKSFDIVTTASYDEKNAEAVYTDTEDYSVEKSSALTVLPEEFKLSVSKKVESGDLFKGDPIDVTYEISNPYNDKTAKNIQIHLPLQQHFDSIGQDTILEIPQLLPGEKAVIEEEKVRAKINTTLTLDKTTITYENEFGDEFHVNTSTVKMSVTGNVIQGPVFNLTKTIPESAGNTEFFTVKLVAVNSGNDKGTIDIIDGNNTFRTTLDAGEQRTFTYSERITHEGKHIASQTTGIYVQDDVTYRTGSNQPTIVIENKPIVSITRIAPDKGSTLEPVRVSLQLQAIETVKNVNITGDQSWFIEEVAGEHIISYELPAKEGQLTLDDIVVTYEFGDERYSISENAKTITIEEPTLLSVTKRLDKETVQAGEDVESIIELVNVAQEPLVVTLNDANEEWKFTLLSQETKEVSHKVNAEHGRNAAVATVVYKDETLIFESNTPGLVIADEENIIKEDNQEIEEDSIVTTIVDFFVSILTWQPRGEG